MLLGVVVNFGMLVVVSLTVYKYFLSCYNLLSLFVMFRTKTNLSFVHFG